MPADLVFRPVREADLPLLRDWMEGAHWRQWWGNADTEIGHIHDMIAGRDTTRPYLFCFDGRPVGYIQVWAIADNLVEPWLTEAPWMTAVPRDCVGVDLSIGPADHLGQGLGTAALTAFVALLRAEGRGSIVIDPDPANLRAIRSYEKAGFRIVPELLGRSGDSLIMMHRKNA